MAVCDGMQVLSSNALIDATCAIRFNETLMLPDSTTALLELLHLLHIKKKVYRSLGHDNPPGAVCILLHAHYASADRWFNGTAGQQVDLYSTRIRLIAGSILTFKFTQSLLMSAGRRARFRYVCIDTLAQWVLQASNCPNGIV
ncbi:hypothetical protein T4B_13244 [Trichinella pseudospiralis]|uniref:Uncharacterized protein n=2 Tax=Trichinella pseudospiralis TaxID=6337 RepID=A0A0V1EGA9_TRIPS|nr:hypothetical protein T4E_11609 [Trichinella pseudospiralis]KRY72680.1 hypothetical protein T4A_7495 [Trichinella pseudospiralis]KRY92242.1 hypothetical protein T4D_7009 [Trichinella pseudospiralis]KRZ22943.1 hypothetical protein T4B_13244 [Trichinella pseudospiralis]KRZ31281.1 hypothetical protein T4C_5793 [Trichinella pseudospiralis]